MNELYKRVHLKEIYEHPKDFLNQGIEIIGIPVLDESSQGIVTRGLSGASVILKYQIADIKGNKLTKAKETIPAQTTELGITISTAIYKIISLTRAQVHKRPVRFQGTFDGKQFRINNSALEDTI